MFLFAFDGDQFLGVLLLRLLPHIGSDFVFFFRLEFLGQREGSLQTLVLDLLHFLIDRFPKLKDVLARYLQPENGVGFSLSPFASS